MEQKNIPVKVSIRPKKNSGFRAKLIKIKEPALMALVKRREKILFDTIEDVLNYSIKRMTNVLTGERKASATKEGEIYKKAIQDACVQSRQDGNDILLKQSIKTAEKKYGDTILVKDRSLASKTGRYILMVLANLGSHIFGIMTLGVGLYFNKRHKEKTGN